MSTASEWPAPETREPAHSLTGTSVASAERLERARAVLHAAVHGEPVPGIDDTAQAHATPDDTTGDVGNCDVTAGATMCAPSGPTATAGSGPSATGAAGAGATMCAPSGATAGVGAGNTAAAASGAGVVFGAPPRTKATRGRNNRDSQTRVGATALDEGDAEDVYERARTICLNQLGYAARTRAQLFAVLTKRGIAESVADDVLERLTDVGLINDEEFAVAWVRSRHRAKGISRRKLSHELTRAGIAPEMAAAAVAMVDDEAEWTAAYALAQKRAQALTTVDADVAARRIAGLLARKGYSPNVCFDVARQVVSVSRPVTESTAAPPLL